MHDSRSTVRSTGAGPIRRPRLGSAVQTVLSVASRSAGIAIVSEWTAALTSAHHAIAAAFAAPTVTGLSPRTASGTRRSALA